MVVGERGEQKNFRLVGTKYSFAHARGTETNKKGVRELIMRGMWC